MLGRGLESLIPPQDPEQRGVPETSPGLQSIPAHEETVQENSFGIPEQVPQNNNQHTSQPSLPKPEEQHGAGVSHEQQEPSSDSPPPTTSSEPSFKLKLEPGLPTEQAVYQIEVDKIVPNPQQPRRSFNEEALKELAASIREFGVLQPLVVTKVEKEVETGTQVEYQLIAGERRLLASRLVGLPRVPAIIRSVSLDREKLELALIENIQRDDLNPIESARAYARLQDDFRLTQREIASKVGKSREFIANALRLLNLPSDIQDAVAEGRVSESQARLLLGLTNMADQQMLFQSIVRENLSVREIKARIQRLGPREARPREKSVSQANPEFEALKHRLEGFLGTKVDLRQDGKTGKLLINFYSVEELQGIVDKFLRPEDN